MAWIVVTRQYMAGNGAAIVNSDNIVLARPTLGAAGGEAYGKTVLRSVSGDDITIAETVSWWKDQVKSQLGDNA